METSLPDHQACWNDDEPSTQRAKELSAAWPTVVIVLILSLRRLELGWLLGPLCIAWLTATLGSLFVVLFDPMLSVWKRSHRSPLYLPYSMALCAFITGWSLLALALPHYLILTEASPETSHETAMMKSLDKTTFELVTQVGLGWFLGVVACLLARRGCALYAPVRPAALWRDSLALLIAPTIVFFSAWLGYLWWNGSQLDPDLLRVHGQLRISNPDAPLVDAVKRVDWRGDLVTSYEPRSICGHSLSDIPPVPELLKWPKRARLNARWRSGEFSD